MLSDNFKAYLSDVLNTEIQNSSALSGGDINEVYKLKTASETLVIKVNDAEAFPNMFELEKAGLDLLSSTQTFHIPKPLLTGYFETKAFLVLEHIESASRASNFDFIFGEQLAALHKHSDSFGLEEDNYIGSLKQFNAKQDDAASFYINQRLEPQFKLALDKGYTFNNLDAFYKRIEMLIPDEPASLIHGDLWSGNYMVDNKSLPVLIDPAVCYAPREMDLALMRLFGGYSETIFESYESTFPLTPGWENRIELWQLYYILVHVNLFGGHYYASAKAILQNYQ